MTSPMTTDTKSGLDVKFSGGGLPHLCKLADVNVN